MEVCLVVTAGREPLSCHGHEESHVEGDEAILDGYQGFNMIWGKGSISVEATSLFTERNPCAPGTTRQNLHKF